MANSFQKATKIVSTALGLLERDIVLPQTVWRYGLADFRGAYNDTINLRVPAIATADDRTLRSGAVLTAHDLTESSIPVVLDKHPNSLVNLPDEELTLDIESLVDQVISRQVRAVAEKLEGYIAAALLAGDYKVGHTIEFNTADPYASLVYARRLLNAANVPMGDRFVVMGSTIEAEFLNDDRVQAANTFGTDSGFREATIGRMFGFTVLSSNAIGANEAYAYHRSAVAFGNVAPAVARGVTWGQTASFEGLALRVAQDYDPTYARDRILVDSYAGVSMVEEAASGKVERAVKFVNALSS